MNLSIMFPGFGKSKREKEEGFFLKNGGAVLKNIISLHNGDCNPIRSYSAQQLQEATGDFRWPIDQGWNYKMYKGVHEEREISVKRFTPGRVDDEVIERIAKEVAIASRMSSHKNVLKLLGCCLEKEIPLLVYEFPTMGNLESHIYDGNNKLSWEQKLRIAIGIANAVAYLHHGLRKTIIHRSIQPSNIFIDQWETAKLFEFQDAIPIPEGETHVRFNIIGTQQAVAPEIITDERYTEKVDVYTFGLLLFQVLTDGLPSSFHYFHSNVSAESGSSSSFPSDDCLEEKLGEHCKIYLQEENRAQVLEYVKLVLRCVKFNPEERPNMIEIGKALRFIKTI